MLSGLPAGLRRTRQGKKLIEAARLLARGELHFSHHRTPDDEPPDSPAPEALEALAAFGLQPQLQQAPDGAARPAPKLFHLWPEHQRTLQVWLLCQTQWRVGGNVATGLDYAGVEALLRIKRLAPRRNAKLMDELQIMERATLAEWAQQRQQQARSQPGAR